mmetsp:Transcript_67371/g.188621  ORF Transcript_67371/g.188621 Transcript_67371/m.188621 type:complete len:233 (-) Transcript_67371:565-1263(-)
MRLWVEWHLRRRSRRRRILTLLLSTPRLWMYGGSPCRDDLLPADLKPPLMPQSTPASPVHPPPPPHRYLLPLQIPVISMGHHPFHQIPQTLLQRRQKYRMNPRKTNSFLLHEKLLTFNKNKQSHPCLVIERNQIRRMILPQINRNLHISREFRRSKTKKYPPQKKTLSRLPGRRKTGHFVLRPPVRLKHHTILLSIVTRTFWWRMTTMRNITTKFCLTTKILRTRSDESWLK